MKKTEQSKTLPIAAKQDNLLRIQSKQPQYEMLLPPILFNKPTDFNALIYNNLTKPCQLQQGESYEQYYNRYLFDA